MNKKRKLTQASWLGHKTIGLTSFRKLAIILILLFTLFGLTNPVFANKTNNTSIGRISNLDPAQDEATSTPISIFTDSPTDTSVEPESTATDVPFTQTPVLTETSESFTPTATVEMPTITQTNPPEPSTVNPTQAQISPTATLTPTATLNPTATLTPTVVPTSKEILPMASGSQYYVSTSGSNSNPGTLASPWKTLSYAAGKLIAGDTLYIRGGTYSEHFSLSADGTQTSPITVTNYNGETVIVDGGGMTIPAHNSGTPLLEVTGDWVIVSNLTVSNSGEQGASLEGIHDLYDNLYVHHSWANGVVLKGNYATAQNMRIWSNSMQNEGETMSVGWGTGISCARYPDYCTIRNSTAWDNWGEGISTFEALHTTIEDNISYNNMQNYYVSDTQNTLFQRNLSYYTPGNVMDMSITTGLLVGDELGVPVPLPSGQRQASKNNTFINNLFVGANNGIMASTSVLTNDLFANNTWADSAGETSEKVNILFNSGTCSNCRFINNIVLQDDSRTIVSVEGTGMTFSNNLWSKAPSSKASGSGDIIGDPQLAKTGSITPGQLTADYFKILSNSPAINKATSMTEVAVDYFQDARGSQPDLGADEFNGTPAPTNTPGASTATKTYTPVPPTPTKTYTPVAPTPTKTNSPVPPTATKTNTLVAPTATRTNTALIPTATLTRTSVPPTPTFTKTVVVPTATKTKTTVPPTATATPTSTPLPVPDLISPVNNGRVLSTRPTFKWNAIMGATSYSFQLSTSSVFSSLIANKNVLTSAYTVTSDLSRSRTYYWRVKANGVKSSAWSQVFQFMSANPPAIPTLAKPASNALLTDYQPRLDWHGSADTFEVQLATDSLFSTSSLKYDWFVNVGTHLDIKPPLPANSIYYWRVCAFDAEGQFSQWSSYRSFKTALLPPTLLDPVSSGAVLITRPTFNWSAVTGATGYKIQVSSVSTFSSRIIDKTVTGPSYIATSDLPRNKILYWRVYATGSRPSAWSAVSSFSSADPPGIPALLSPASNGSSNVNTLALDWNDPFNAVKYEVQIATSSTFDAASILIDTFTTSSTFTPPSPLTANRTFYWRVSAFNIDKEYSRWSLVRYFHTNLPAPDLISPTDGEIASSAANFDWQDVKETTGYTIQISADPNFKSYVVNTTVTTSNYSKILLKAQKYYWRVKTKGTYTSEWSEVKSFTTQ